MLTQAKYNAIICMLRGGATDEDIMTSQGINENTLKKIKDSNEDFEQYRRLHAEMLKHVNGGRKKTCTENPPVQVVEHKQTITMVANHYMMEQLQMQTRMLTLLNNKMTLLCEALGCMDDKEVAK